MTKYVRRCLNRSGALPLQMAARRLLIIMLVLLGISSVLAVVVREPRPGDPKTGETSVTGTEGNTGTGAATGPSSEDTGRSTSRNERESGPDGEHAVSARTVVMGGRQPERIRVKAGSRLIVTVKSDRGSEVEINGLGLAGFADPFAPAYFDLILPASPGRYPVGAPGAPPDAIIISRS